MTKRNLDSFDLFGGDSFAEGQNSYLLFDERSKSVSHECRFSLHEENVPDFENKRNSTKIEDIQS